MEPVGIAFVVGFAIGLFSSSIIKAILEQIKEYRLSKKNKTISRFLNTK